MSRAIRHPNRAAAGLLAAMVVFGAALLSAGPAQAVGPDYPAAPVITPLQAIPTSESSPSFAIDGDPAATLACRLDDAEDFTTCASPLTVGPLTDGQHTLTVVQVDGDGNQSAEAAIYSFEVDTQAPDPPGLSLFVPSTGTFAVPDTGFATKEGSAKVEFSSSDPDQVTYQCSVDGGTAADCESPFSAGLSGLADGEHTVAVTQTDEAGNVSEPATVSWTVDNQAPELVTFDAPFDSWIGTPTWRGSATETITWSLVTDSGSQVRSLCSLDGGPDEDCDGAETTTLTGLPDGPHTLTVTAVDAAGNRATPVAVSWTTDTTAPEPPSVRSTPTGFTKLDSASIGFAGEGGATFSCSVNGGTSEACTSPLALNGLADGIQEVAVTQTDRAGNESAPATVSWTVDNGAPQFASGVESDRSGNTAYRTATLSWTASDDFSADTDITSSCRITRSVGSTTTVGAWTACESPKAISNLSTGDISFEVRLRDQAGNEAIESAAWTVVRLSVASYPDLDADPIYDVTVGNGITATDPVFADSSDTYTDSSIWQRCFNVLVTSCVAVDGTADDPTYIPGEDDIGKRLRYVVTRTTDDGASVSAPSRMSGLVIPEADTPSEIGGLTEDFDDSTAPVPAYARTLTAIPVTWTTSVGGRSTAYRWQRCSRTAVGSIAKTCKTIVIKVVRGVTDWADESTYQVRTADLGKRLRLLTGVNMGGGKYVWSASEPSEPVRVVGQNTSEPQIVLRPGATVPQRAKAASLRVGTWRFTLAGQYRFRWMSCTTSSEESCSFISRATRSSYVPNSYDVGKRLRVRVTYVGNDGTPVSAYSAISGVTVS